jgi:signal peptidase I
MTAPTPGPPHPGETPGFDAFDTPNPGGDQGNGPEWAATSAAGEPRPDRTSRHSGMRSAIEWVVVIVGAVLVATVIRMFVIQAFYIPSESMVPTLEKNDRVLVNKLSYRLHDVNRGDIVVFERPEGAGGSDVKDLIKRVVGLENEQIVIENNTVYIDGQALDEPYLPEGTITSSSDGVTCTRQSPCTVPEDHVFVMGDNRTNSQDSRYVQVGPIPEDDIVGRAFVIIWPPGRITWL